MCFKHLLLILFAFGVNYSFATSQWTQRADFPGSGRHRATGASVGNKGYLGLGHYNGTGVETYFSDWWEYDPGTNAWAQKADFIGNNGLGELGARTISLETVCFVGLGELDHTRLYKYDPALNTWVQVASPPPSNNFRDTQDLVIGHKAYFTDLYDDELYEYDTDLDLWTLKGMLPFAAYFVYSGFEYEGKGYIKAFDELWEYDPVLNSWAFINLFPGYAELASLCFMQDEKAYIVCGHGPMNADVTSEVWQYDPATQIWLQMEDFPGTSRRYSEDFTIGERCYLATGTNGTNFKDFWEFNAVAALPEFDASSFSVYPNPVVDKVNFTSDKTSSFGITIYNLEGKKMHVNHTDKGSITIDRNDAPAGTYIYNVDLNGSQVHSGKLIYQ